jgi:ribonuclease VapC
LIVIDTSALMAVVLDEPTARSCTVATAEADRVAISAATVAEAMIVADRKGLGAPMRRLLNDLGLEIVDVTPTSASRVADAYSRWGKGVHRARLNLGDCFAYALAKERGCPLLFVGDDFSRTDIASAL